MNLRNMYLSNKKMRMESRHQSKNKNIMDKGL